jgi:excinuclease ABC subunit B
MSVFKISQHYQPAGDQPKAIEALVKGIKAGERHQVLLGATGTGKTFTAANVIQAVGKPTLVIAHNKTLAAQLASEYRTFFPDAAVHYFVSYYDYYQPEAYVPTSDTYIEKEAMVNEDIERLRHAATQALLTRKDVIIVASVSCIYGLGSPEQYEKVNLKFVVGQKLSRAEAVRRLIELHFERTNADLSPGSFRALGNTIELIPASERMLYRIQFSADKITKIDEMDAVTRALKGERDSLFVFPAKHYITPEDVRAVAVADIKDEFEKQLALFKKQEKILEADRLKRRIKQDIAMIKEFGYCNGIENYSMHFDRRKPGEPPYTLLSYFPTKKDGTPDFLTIIDESHVSVPQIGGMYAGDRSRKLTLIEHGFRLPSALDNRPLQFPEFEQRIGLTIYTSATPGTYELEHSPKPIEQIIRPTGLIDPEISLRPVVEKGDFPGQVKDFIKEVIDTTSRNARTLGTVLTKKMAEDLSQFLIEKGIKAKYLHSDVKTIERIEILTDFRRGEFDVLIGVNLLREGLDLPEVELVGILDADKEGFLRSGTSLIQTIGRAARNVAGRVILYGDVVTGSMDKAIKETNRRREIQLAYNKEHNITPTTIIKNIEDITADIQKMRARAVTELAEVEEDLGEKDLRKKMLRLRREMHEAADNLDFETAALIRDEIRVLEEKNGKKLGK